MNKETVSKLRNCLTVLLLETDMVLEKENLSEEGRKSVQKIKDKGWEISKVISDGIPELQEYQEKEER